MKTFYYILALVLGMTACKKEPQPLIIPDLTPRLSKIDTAEFNKAQAQVVKFREQIKQHPETIKNYSDLATVYIQEARVTGRHHEYFPVAERLLDEALMRDSLFFDALTLKAGMQMTKHRFAEAKVSITKALSGTQYSSGAYGILADANTELGKYDEALAAVDKMMSARPDLRAYARASYQREIHGDLDGALSAMRLAVDAGAYGQENREWTVYQYANLFLHSGKTDTAAFLYNGSLEERPDYGYALSGLAMVAAAKQDYGKAIELLAKASQVLPEHLFIEQLSDIYLAMGDTTNAHVMEAKVLETFAQHEKDSWNIDREYAAYCANHSIHLEEALQRAERDHTSRPDNVDALDTHAWVLFRMGKAAEAKPLIERALRFNTLNPIFYVHAALIEQAAGDNMAAAKYRSQLHYLPPVFNHSSIASN